MIPPPSNGWRTLRAPGAGPVAGAGHVPPRRGNGAGAPRTVHGAGTPVHGYGAELHLGEWSEAGVAAYLTQRGAGAEVPAALVRVLTQRTDGHPLFLVTVVDELVRQGRLQVAPTGWVLAGGLDGRDGRGAAEHPSLAGAPGGAAPARRPGAPSRGECGGCGVHGGSGGSGCPAGGGRRRGAV